MPRKPKQTYTADDLDKLPFEITTKTFAGFMNCSRSTVLNMIRKNIISARALNPEAKRPTYRIPSWSLRHALGVPEKEPEYVSLLLSGRL